MKLKLFILLSAITPLASIAQVYNNPTATPLQRAESIVAEMTLEEKAALMQNYSPAIPRLGIKQYNWWNEALHGVGRAGLATVFPQPIGMAASFNESLPTNSNTFPGPITLPTKLSKASSRRQKLPTGSRVSMPNIGTITTKTEPPTSSIIA